MEVPAEAIDQAVRWGMTCYALVGSLFLFLSWFGWQVTRTSILESRGLEPHRLGDKDKLERTAALCFIGAVGCLAVSLVCCVSVMKHFVAPELVRMEAMRDLGNGD